MAQLPRFFNDGPLANGNAIALDPDTAKHICQVLRMRPGEKLTLTDGKGNTATGIILTTDRLKCVVSLSETEFHARHSSLLHLSIAFTKNTGRNEWLLEKAAELGVASIIPLKVTRSEPVHAKTDRWQKILQSAMLQSQQNYLTGLSDTTTLSKVLELYQGKMDLLIAHCIQGHERAPLSKMLNQPHETLILIGPEGDFTPDEVNLCISRGCKPVSLGKQRLRTETAAIAAAAYFNVMNDE